MDMALGERARVNYPATLLNGRLCGSKELLALLDRL